MTDFGSMKTWIAKRLQDPSNTAVSAADIGETINQAIGYWKKRRFWFNEVQDSTTLSESNPTIPLPANFLCPSIDNAFVIEYSGMRYPLKKVGESMYDSIYLSNGVGQPFWFARLASAEYQCYPIPDRDYTLYRYYLKDYDDLVNDSDTNDWTEEVADLIQYTALAYATRDFRQDLIMAKEFMAEANDEYQNALLRTRKENATGSLEVSSALF